MADDGGERLDVHPVLKGRGGECMAEIVEPHVPALRPLEDLLHCVVYIMRVHGGILIDRGGEHPLRIGA